MNQCIKCGRGIPDGELFCAECSKDPIIASLGHTPSVKAPPRTAPVRKPAPTPPKKQKNRTLWCQAPYSKIVPIPI